MRAQGRDEMKAIVISRGHAASKLLVQPSEFSRG